MHRYHSNVNLVCIFTSIWLVSIKATATLTKFLTVLVTSSCTKALVNICSKVNNIPFYRLVIGMNMKDLCQH